MRISDWSSDVCSSDLELLRRHARCPPGADLHDPADRARDLSRPGGGDNRDGSLRRHGACHRNGDVGRRAGAGEEGCLTAPVFQQAHRPPATRAQERLWRLLTLTALLGIRWLARDRRLGGVLWGHGFLLKGLGAALVVGERNDRCWGTEWS